MVVVTGAGCGSGKDDAGSRGGPAAEAGAVAAAAATSGQGFTVDPTKVPMALVRQGLKVTFRHGPLPHGFIRAFYGRAENARHVGINFAVFLTAKPGAERFYTKAMLKLVPGAKVGDGTVGIGYATITTKDPRTRAYSRRKNEEYEVTAALESAVAGLAPKAVKVEGP